MHGVLKLFLAVCVPDNEIPKFHMRASEPLYRAKETAQPEKQRETKQHHTTATHKFPDLCGSLHNNPTIHSAVSNPGY